MIKHLAFIMDGNRRFAKYKNISIKNGYKAGMEKFLEAIRFQIKYDISETSFFALSNENYKLRPNSEIKTLSNLIKEFSKNKEIKKFFERNKIKINLIGNISKLRQDKSFYESCFEELESWNEKLKTPEFIVNLALNYNGQEEILHSFKETLKKVESGEIKVLDIDLSTIKNNLWFSKSLPPEVIVRYGKVNRLSGFMLFDSNYSEIYFSNKYWPEFNEKDFVEVIDWFEKIKRNFGK